MLIIVLYVTAAILFINRRRPGAPRGLPAPQHRSSRRMSPNDEHGHRDDAPGRHDEFYLVSSNFGVFDGAAGCGVGSNW